MLLVVQFWTSFLVFSCSAVTEGSTVNINRRRRICSRSNGKAGSAGFCGHHSHLNTLQCHLQQRRQKKPYTCVNSHRHNIFNVATDLSPTRLSLSLNESSDDDYETARSQFGTRQYWDDTYNGYGDFPMEEYSWYYGWDVLRPFVMEHFPPPPPQKKKSNNDSDGDGKGNNMLLPGIGNDPILLDLLGAGYTCITAFDYTSSAIERQKDLLSYVPGSFYDHDDNDDNDNNNDDNKGEGMVKLYVRDARKLASRWTNKFDFILEKGTLDAIYLSGDGNVEQAVSELKRVLNNQNGILMSVSGVVPYGLRKELFPADEWEWIRDGSEDLKAGCFVLRLR